MKIFFPLIIVIALLPSALNAQNLFSNPDFEMYSVCPTGNSQMANATGWIQVIESCDYVNCSYNGWTTQQIIGAQSGTGYAGFATYGGILASEYTGQSLAAPLVQGSTYNFSFYSKRTNGAAYGQICNGICFYGWVGNPAAGGSQSGICPDQLPGYYFLGCSDTIINTLWQAYQLTFTAPAPIDFIAFGVGCTSGCGEYAYIDNIIFQNVTGISKTEFENGIQIFPSLVSDQLNIINKSHPVDDVEILSTAGQLLIKMVCNHQNQIVLDVTDLKEGIYFVKIKSNEMSATKKFLKK